MKYKFRAYNKEMRKMILLDPLQWPLKVLDEEENWKVMMFTGLLDRHGKEIYEGDIVIVRSQYETDEPVESRNKVYFRDGAFRCGFHNMILMENVCTGIEGNWNMEVIGNIYENPELAGGTLKGPDLEG